MSKITLAEFFGLNQMSVIECHTREQSDAVRKAFHAFGKKWSSGDSFLELDYWRDGDEYIHYSNDCCKSKQRPRSDWLVYDFDDVVELSGAPIPEPDPHQFRILRRGDYRWYDAIWDSKENEITVGKKSFSPTEIISIENDPRVKYVQCTKCGEVIKNTKKAIEEHLQLSQSSKGCLTCRSLRSSEEKMLKESYVKNDDGTYTRVNKTICSLVCGYAYRNPLIDDAKARGGCRYKNCRADTIGPIDDFFIKYPGAFDDMATVDAIDASKWQVSCRYMNGDVTLKWKDRYNIVAYTTNLGIIDRFVCSYRSNNHEIVYSKKYDKIFELSYGTYVELTASDSPFSATYYKELMKIIRNIYKGED